MNTITVIIPTRNRYKKLARCLATIPKHDWLKVFVYFDGCPPPISKRNGLTRIDEVFHSTLNVGSVAARNFMAQFVEDGLIWMCDDMTFQANVIETARELFNVRYPDDDGVIGFEHDGCDFHPSGVGLMGKRFLERYPGKQFLYPEYWLFAAQEIYDLAVKVGRFKLSSLCRVYHYHPIHHKEEMDQTHHDGRGEKKQFDKTIRQHRKRLGLIWGDQR